MYITNKEIIKHLFQRSDINHVIISSNEFCTYAIAIDDKNNVIETLNDINIEIDNNNFEITEYDDEFNVKDTCIIPLTYLIKNSNPINM